MAENKTVRIGSKRFANSASFLMFFFICAAFVFDTLMIQLEVNYIYAGLYMVFALIIFIFIIKSTLNLNSLAFSVPFILLIFYSVLAMVFDWHSDHYLLFCLIFTAISCTYSHFFRTLFFIIVQNLFTAVLFTNNVPIGGINTPMYTVFINWAVCLFAGVIMLFLTRAVTIHLEKALTNQQSFIDLLDTTENYVAMINERNEVVFASRSLSQLSSTDEPLMVQGRPVLDLFPGKSLKIYAHKMLREKEKYAEDWEFSLDGQKRYFKAASYGVRGGGGSALISLYDMTHLAERDEIAAMKDSMKIGLFFMDANYVIQDHYSRYLEVMLSDTRLYGKVFTDMISHCVSQNELGAIQDYFKMVMERSYDQEMLDDINPLNELHYVNQSNGERKVFQFAFATVERGRGEVFLLVTVYDITARVELQQRLAEEEARRQEEMQSLFELIQVEPSVFSDFMQDMEVEFETIDSILKNDVLSTHDALVKIYQSVHAVKSNAVTLGLNIFGNKVHNLESRIKKMREAEGDVPFSEMLNLTMDIEKLYSEKEGFKDIINKLHTYTKEKTGESVQDRQKVLIDSLEKTAVKAAGDLGKHIKFSAHDIDAAAVEKVPRRVVKEILMQLIRNSAVHGIETPEERVSKGKNETGVIKLSIKLSDDHKHVHIKLADDGQGLDYKKIAKKALDNNLIKDDETENKDALLKAVFSPGFSTAEKEGVHGGRGIGLNLVRDRIKEVKGTVKLRSDNNKGVVFLISIPVRSDQ